MRITRWYFVGCLGFCVAASVALITLRGGGDQGSPTFVLGFIGRGAIRGFVELSRGLLRGEKLPQRKENCLISERSAVCGSLRCKTEALRIPVNVDHVTIAA